MSTEHDGNLGMADILIEDDESTNLKQLSNLLGRQGLHVRPANISKLTLNSALGKPPDLILMDILSCRLPNRRQNGKPCSN